MTPTEPSHFLVRSGTYGTRAYGGATGARVPRLMVLGVGAFISGGDFWQDTIKSSAMAHIAFVPVGTRLAQRSFIQAWKYYAIHAYIQASPQGAASPSGNESYVILETFSGETSNDGLDEAPLVDTDISGEMSNYSLQTSYESDPTLTGSEGQIVLEGNRAKLSILHAHIVSELVVTEIDTIISGFISGHFVQNSSSALYIPGLSSTRISYLAFVSGTESSDGEVGLYLAGGASLRRELSAFLFGGSAALSTKRIFLRGRVGKVTVDIDISSGGGSVSVDSHQRDIIIERLSGDIELP